MARRDLLTVGLLTFFTCGLYALYWQFKTTEELKQVTGKSELNPTLELVVSIVTCGIFSIYAHYRNAQLVTERMRALNPAYEDKATMVLVLDLASLVVGVTWLVAVLVLQDEFNKLADASSGVAPVEQQKIG